MDDAPNPTRPAREPFIKTNLSSKKVGGAGNNGNDSGGGR